MAMSASAHSRGRTGLMPVAPVVFLAPDVPDVPDDAAEDDHRRDHDRGTPSRTPFAADEVDGADSA